MKKEYKKPIIGLLPTKCDISTLSPEKPEDMDTSRRSLLMRIGMVSTVGSLIPLHASQCQGEGPDCGNGSGGSGSGSGSGSG